MVPWATTLLFLASPAFAADSDSKELEKLRDQLREVDTSIQTMQKELGREIAYVRERFSLVIATSFLTSPPPSSDSVGVARVPVFGPRLEADTSRHRDSLNVRIKRVEASGMRVIGADLEVTSGQPSVPLPVDQNGALYVVEWWTSEGFNYPVQIRDGATEQPVATVQVRPQQNKGRFLYVGYRLD
jgi:hypothetical protein